MLGQIVEIEQEGRRLSLERGFLVVSSADGPLGKVPLDDIEAVIISNPAASLTTQVIAALMQRGAPIVISGPDYKPCSILLPLDGHHAQGNRLEAQMAASVPLGKRLWAELVAAKIAAQAGALQRCGIECGPIKALATRVRSGDPDNFEAIAAQRYFPLLFGKHFRRFRNSEGANAMLNYGYTVLRAATARAIVAAGLHPSIALHHRSRGDALRLADDLMEPFRPAVDLQVRQLIMEGEETLTTPVKRALAAVLHADYETAEGVTILSNALNRLAVSLAQVFEGERKTLALPLSPVPLAPENSASNAGIAA